MAASYMLDTCIVIAAMKGEPRSLLNHLAGLAPSRLFLSSMVHAELLYETEKSQHPLALAHLIDVIGYEASGSMPCRIPSRCTNLWPHPGCAGLQGNQHRPDRPC